jgi:hypothetical protein
MPKTAMTILLADWEEEDGDISLTSDLNAKNTTAAAALPSNNNGTKKKRSAISKVPIILYDAMVEKLDGKSTIYSKEAAIKSELKSVQKHPNAIVAATAKVKKQIPDLYARANNHKIFPARVHSKGKKIEYVKCCVSSFAVMYELFQCCHCGLDCKI